MSGRSIKPLFAVVVAVWLQGTLVFAVEPKELVGTFTSKVTEPDGSTYEGTCEITHKAGRVIDMVWHYGKQRSIGVGKLVDDVLTIKYEGAIVDREGQAKYEIKSKDRLIGSFKRKGTKGLGKEILVREKAES